MVGAKVWKQENEVTTFIFVVLENCCPFEESIHAASKQIIYFSDILNPNIYLTSLFPAITPSLPSRPVITPELIGHSVYLRCSFIPPPWSQALGFQVVWARHIGHNMKVEIRQESILKPFSLVEMDGIHFRLGETVISTRLSWSYDEGSTCGRLYHSSRKCEPQGNVCHIQLRQSNRKVEMLNQLQVGQGFPHMGPISIDLHSEFSRSYFK